jgi:hypothetical protein
LVIGVISGRGGVVNIAAGGDILDLKVCRIIPGDGDINIIAGDSIDATVGSTRGWSIQGVNFSAQSVSDTIKSAYVTLVDAAGAEELLADIPQV